MKTAAQTEACAIADQIRSVYAIHPVRVGWFARPHHTNRQIKVGHRDYGVDPVITDECNTLVEVINLLGMAEHIGYEVVACNH